MSDNKILYVKIADSYIFSSYAPVKIPTKEVSKRDSTQARYSENTVTKEIPRDTTTTQGGKA